MMEIQTAKKRILFFIGSMAGGGAERALVEILNNLDRTRYIPGLALYRKEGPYLDCLSQDLQLYELPGCSAGYKKLFRTMKMVSTIVNSFKPDIAISVNIGANLSVLRYNIIARQSIPVIIVEQNNFTKTLIKTGKYLNYFEVKYLYGKAKKIVAVSDGIKMNMVNVHGMNKDHFAVIQNPVDINKIQKIININDKSNQDSHGTRRELKIISVGRLTKQKGFSDLLNAFSIVLKFLPAKLIILGEGELRVELERQARELGLDSHLEMPGFVDDPWTRIHASDLYVMSSYWEGLPLVLLETMACGTPIVSTDCDYGPREIITHGNDGMLVPVGDVHLMSKTIIQLLKDEHLRMNLAANAKETVKFYDSRIVTRQYEQLIEGVLSKEYDK